MFYISSLHYDKPFWCLGHIIAASPHDVSLCNVLCARSWGTGPRLVSSHSFVRSLAQRHAPPCTTSIGILALGISCLCFLTFGSSVGLGTWPVLSFVIWDVLSLCCSARPCTLFFLLAIAMLLDLGSCNSITGKIFTNILSSADLPLL